MPGREWLTHISCAWWNWMAKRRAQKYAFRDELRRPYPPICSVRRQDPVKNEFYPAEDRFSEYTRLELSLHPYEIATLYLDLARDRKVYRNLDCDRKVWATVNRVEDK
jgi:hypothetical protein